MQTQKGFTLLEIIISVAIFSLVAIVSLTMLVIVVRLQTRQSSTAEVNRQSQFIFQTLQYYIEQSSLVDMPQDTATSTLRLRMPTSAQDPTIVSLQGGTVYIQQGNGSQQALSSDRVVIPNLTFIKRSNPPAHDSVSIALTVTYNTANVQQLFSQMLQSSVARVSAATFDSNVIPSSTATYSLGVAGQIWNSINGLIYFSGNNVGVGSAYTSPQQALDISGGVRINSQGSQPSCDANARGTLWDVQSGGGDSLKFCAFTSSSVYQWVTIY